MTRSKMDSIDHYDPETFEITAYDLPGMLENLERLSTKELSDELAKLDQFVEGLAPSQLRVLGDVRREVIRSLLVGMDPLPYIERVSSDYPRP